MSAKASSCFDTRGKPFSCSRTRPDSFILISVYGLGDGFSKSKLITLDGLLLFGAPIALTMIQGYNSSFEFEEVYFGCGWLSLLTLLLYLKSSDLSDLERLLFFPVNAPAYVGSILGFLSAFYSCLDFVLSGGSLWEGSIYATTI